MQNNETDIIYVCSFSKGLEEYRLYRAFLLSIHRFYHQEIRTVEKG